MFLNRLDDNEKQAFLVLAHHIAQSDAEFSPEEQVIIAQYSLEMGRPDVDYDKKTFDLREVLNEFKDEHRNVVLLELAALTQVDGVVSSTEGDILNSIVEYFGTNPDLFFVFNEWAKNMISLYLQGDALTRV